MSRIVTASRTCKRGKRTFSNELGGQATLRAGVEDGVDIQNRNGFAHLRGEGQI